MKDKKQSTGGGCAWFLALVALLAVAAYIYYPSKNYDTRVFDNARVFKASQRTTLSKQVKEAAEFTLADIAIHTTDGLQGESIGDHAAWFYKTNGTVATANGSLLLVIDMEESEIFLYALGKTEQVYTEKAMDAALDSMFAALDKNGLYGAAEAFVQDARGRLGKSNTVPEGAARVALVVIGLLMGCVVGGWSVARKRGRLRAGLGAGADMASYTPTGVVVTSERDTLVDTSTTSREMTPKEKQERRQRETAAIATAAGLSTAAARNAALPPQQPGMVKPPKRPASSVGTKPLAASSKTAAAKPAQSSGIKTKSSSKVASSAPSKTMSTSKTASTRSTSSGSSSGRSSTPAKSGPSSSRSSSASRPSPSTSKSTGSSASRPGSSGGTSKSRKF